MSSQEAREEWGPVLHRSTNHLVTNVLNWHIDYIYQVCTMYIPVIFQHQSIYLVYTKDIYNISLVYTMYIADVGIYLVYTWFIPM